MSDLDEANELLVSLDRHLQQLTHERDGVSQLFDDLTEDIADQQQRRDELHDAIINYLEN